MPTVEEALKHGRLLVDEHRYVFAKLHPHAITLAAAVIAEIAEPYAALVIDHFEITLVIRADDFEAYASRLKDAQRGDTVFRVITLDVEFTLDVVGVMARLSAVLAQANIPIMPFAAYSRDHILVPEDQLEAALSALQTLVG
jgi:hypothetical protein